MAAFVLERRIHIVPGKRRVVERSKERIVYIASVSAEAW